MKKVLYLILILSVFISVNAYSQIVTEQLELSKPEVNTNNDGKLIERYKLIANDFYYKSQTDSALHYIALILLHDTLDYEVYHLKGEIYQDRFSFFQNTVLTPEVNYYKKLIVGSFDQAIKLNKNCSTCYYNKSEFYYDIEDYNAALLNIDSSLIINPTFSFAIFQKGKILNQLNKKKEAITYFELSENTIFKLQSFRYIADIHYEFENYKEALKAYRLLYKEDYSKIITRNELLLRISNCYSNLGKDKKAIRYLKLMN